MKSRGNIRICTGLLLITQTFIPIIALQKTNVDEFTVEDQRTQNYIMKRAMDDGISGNVVDTGVKYTTDYLDTESRPEELPSFIVDYANMIRNDIVLLDKSVETRTRKRGNIKVEKYNQAMMDTPCSCEQLPYSKENIYLGEEYFPSSIETRNCNKHLCPSFYSCQKSLYNITILKKTGYKNEVSQVEVPPQFRNHWVANRLSVTIGCVCTRDHVDNN